MAGLSLVPLDHRDMGYLSQLDCKPVFRRSFIQGQGLVLLAADILGRARQSWGRKISFWCLTLVPDRLAGYTNPLGASRTFSLRIVRISTDLHQL